MHPSFDLPMIEIPLILGILFLVIGLFFNFFPPQKINSFYGYRTSTSMESQEKWDFAQKFSAVKTIQGSVFLLAVSCLGLFDLTQNQQNLIGIAAVLIFLIAVIFLTEKALKKQFPKS